MGYCLAFVISSAMTVLCALANPYIDHSNLIMIYLLAIVFIATRFGRGPSIFASVLSVGGFDYFCVQPHFSLAVSDWQYLITFAVMLTIAVLITTLTSEAQRQTELARSRERRGETLRAFSADLSLTRGRDNLVEVSLRHIRTYFDAMVGVYLPDKKTGVLTEYTADGGLARVDRADNEIALYVYQNRESSGLGKGPYASAGSLYVPLLASQGVVGVLQISPRDHNRLAVSDDFDLLDSLCKHAALCIEVANLTEQAQLSSLQIEREQLRNVLLSSVSHDLRTPLATITGASSSLVEGGNTLSESEKQELAEVILEESENLNNLVRNLLEMTKLEAGVSGLRKSWVSVEELIGAAMTRLDRHLKERQVQIKLPDRLPLLWIDEMLMQQVILNIIENAIKYTPEKSRIEINVSLSPEDPPGYLKISILDEGPGIKDGEEQHIFTKFYRSASAEKHLGVGLGLAICKAIVDEHGGNIRARSREAGGAEFEIDLPLESQPPAADPEAGLADELLLMQNSKAIDET